METGPAFASLMIEAIADGVSVVDAGGHPLIVNQALCDMTGFSREELLARQPFAYPFWPAEEHGHISATFRRMQAGELGPYELVFCRKSGERFPVSIAPGVATADGERVFITTIKDLTELRREQERVRELSRLVDAMIQAGDLATWEWDLVTDEMHLSQSWYTMLGLPSGPAVTSTGAMIERVHPDDFDATQDSIGALLMGHRPLYEVEHRLRSVDGSWRWFLARGVVMERGADGRPSRIGGTNQDIHRIKQQEAFLQQWQKLEVLGELTGGIAHDFNNALMVLQSNTGLLRMDGYPEQQEGLDDMEESLVRAAALTESLQRYVHREQPPPQRIDLGVFIRDAHGVLATAAAVTAVLELQLDPDTPAVHTGPGDLDHALINLVLNARDALGDTTGAVITVATARREVDDETAAALGCAPGTYATITVEDNGRGMTADVLQRATEPLFTTKESGVGTGFGLTAVRRCVDDAGGFFELVSAVGDGTRATVGFPAAPDEPEQPHPAPSVPPRQRHTALRVLLVDDELPVRRSLSAALASSEVGVLVAASPKEALELLVDHEVDVLVTDLTMPYSLNGLGLAHRARTLLPGLPVVFMTGYGGRRAEAEAMEVGPVLRKPFTVEVLQDTIRSVLE